MSRQTTPTGPSQRRALRSPCFRLPSRHSPLATRHCISNRHSRILEITPTPTPSTELTNLIATICTTWLQFQGRKPELPLRHKTRRPPRTPSVRKADRPFREEPKRSLLGFLSAFNCRLSTRPVEDERKSLAAVAANPNIQELESTPTYRKQTAATRSNRTKSGNSPWESQRKSGGEPS